MNNPLDRPFLDLPLHFDGRGRTATTNADDHVRDLIFSVLFTDPGERVNRPDFGCGIRSLLFMPASDTLAAATQVLVKGSLQKWLENEIQVERVEVKAEDSKLLVTVAYVHRASGEGRVEVFSASL